MKRFVTLLLSVAMIMTLSPVWVLAAEETAPAKDAPQVVEQPAETDVAQSNEVQTGQSANAEDETAFPAEEGENEAVLAGDYFYQFESSYIGAIKKLLIGEGIFYRKNDICYTDDSDIQNGTDGVEAILNSITVKSGEAADIVQINSDEDNEGYDAFVVAGAKLGSTILEFNYSIKKDSSSSKTVTIEAPVEVLLERYELNFETSMDGNLTNGNTYLPSESFTLTAEPGLNRRVTTDDESYIEYFGPKDALWDDYQIKFECSSNKITLESSGDKSCDVSIADGITSYGEYTINYGIYDGQTLLAEDSYTLYVQDSATRLELEGAPTEWASGETHELTAKLYYLSYDNTISKELATDATYEWDSWGNFTVTSKSGNTWDVTRNSGNATCLRLQALYPDGLLSILLDYDGQPISELTINGPSSIFVGSQAKFEVDADSLSSVDYSKIKWRANYYDGDTDTTVDIPSKYLKPSADGKSCTIISDNVKAIAKLLGVNSSSDFANFTLQAEAVDGGGYTVSVGTTDVDVEYPYVSLDDFYVGNMQGINKTKALIGNTYFIPKANSVSVRNAESPDGGSVEASVTGVTSSNTTSLKVIKTSDGWTVKPVKASSKAVTLTVSYKYKGKTGKETLSVTIVNEDFFITYDQSNGDECHLLKGQSTKIKPSCIRNYYDANKGVIEEEEVSDIEWEIQAPNPENATEVDSSFTPADGWQWKLDPKADSDVNWDEYIDGDEYIITAAKNGKILADAGINFTVLESYYTVQQELKEIELTDGVTSYTPSDIAQIYYYDSTHPEGTLANGDNGTEDYNSQLEFLNVDTDFFELNDNVLTVKSSDAIAKIFNSGCKNTWCGVVACEDPDNPGIYDFSCYADIGLNCKHNKTEGQTIDPAGINKKGMEGCYHCDACGRNFADPDYTQAIESAKEIPAIKTYALEKTSFEYTGKAIEPKAVIKDTNKNQLVEGRDYTISYDNNTDVTSAGAKAKANISFTGKYAGNVTLEFDITPTAQKVDAAIEIDNKGPNEEALYVSKNTAKVVLNPSEIAGTNAGEITSVTTKNKKVATVAKVGDDWVVTPKAAGTVDLTVSVGAKGNYKAATGTVKVKVIAPVKITTVNLAQSSFKYNGEAQKPEVSSVTTKVNKKTVTLDASLYDVSYDNNTNAGKKALAIVTVKNDCFEYYGTISKAFTITKADQTMDVALKDDTPKDYPNGLDAFIGQYTGSPYIQIGTSDDDTNVGKITVTSSNKKVATVVTTSDPKVYALKLGTKAGTAKITVTAAGNDNYNKASVVYTVKLAQPAKLTSSMISFKNDYAGGRIIRSDERKLLSKSDIEVKNGNTVLNDDDYLIEIHGDNTQIGNYQVIIKVKELPDIYGFVGGSSASTTYSVVLEAPVIDSLTPAAKSFTAVWTAPTNGQVDGYELRYSTKESMASSKTVKIASGTTLTTAVKKLSAKKKYYVQVRAYTNYEKSKIYSDWSTKQDVTTP